ncbi:MAG: DUF4097 family beta strand repeat protein [Sedimentisphaerales bacterium]|nr:DUF4097 family beta strand repeat protein [Sedimentisphaerales bacterium]
MEDNNAKTKSLIFSLVFITFLSGCVIYVGSGCQSEKFSKIVHMPVTPLSPGLNFQAQTHNGSIEIHGEDVIECNITATITGWASSEKKAEEIVERTELRIDQSESGLVFVIDKPRNLVNCSVGVSLDVVLPNEVNLNLVSHNGRIEIENISGNTNATTHNGKVSVNNISGITDLGTHNGKIEAKEISGDINFVSHNGKVEAVFSQAAEPDCDIIMVTHNGGIELTAPQNYSAKVNVSTHNGHIDTELPITVLGKFSNNKLVGTIGDAQGNTELTTHNGSIKIK